MNRFVIYGKPMGKGRPRFSRAGRFVRTFTPEATANYETLVKLAYQGEGCSMMEGEVRAEIVAYFQIPKSVSKKKRLAMARGEVRPTSKPDCDNIAKIVLDALNGLAYKDDSSVVSLRVEKLYAEEPRVEVSLYGSAEAEPMVDMPSMQQGIQENGKH